MKRRLIKLALFLILGLIINIGVSWGCAVTSPRFSLYDIQTELPDAETERLWRRYIGELDDAYYFFRTSGSVRGVTMLYLVSFPPIGPSMEITISQQVDIFQAGWPFRSLEGTDHFENDLEKDKRWKNNLISLHPLPWPERTYNWYGHIPTSPIWLGFIANVIFWASVLWLLTLGPFTARRMIRRKRGHCIKCGYDLSHAEHDVCPECGVPTV